MTNISISMLSEINWGKRHYDEKEIYPLNKMTGSRVLTDEQVKEIIILLQSEQYTCHQIGQKFNVSDNAIQDINAGRSYKQDNLTYPIKKQRVISGKRKVLDEITLELLINEIINTNIPFSLLS